MKHNLNAANGLPRCVAIEQVPLDQLDASFFECAGKMFSLPAREVIHNTHPRALRHSASTRVEPINEAPPVTSTRVFVQSITIFFLSCLSRILPAPHVIPVSLSDSGPLRDKRFAIRTAAGRSRLTRARAVAPTSSASIRAGSSGSRSSQRFRATNQPAAPATPSSVPQHASRNRGGNDFFVGTTGESSTFTVGISFASCTLAISY